jgi:hypothetical protein
MSSAGSGRFRRAYAPVATCARTSSTYARRSCSGRGEIEGRDLELIELIEDDENGLIKKRIAAYRPLPAVELFRSAMYPSIKGWLEPEYFSYRPEDSSSLPAGHGANGQGRRDGALPRGSGGSAPSETGA